MPHILNNRAIVLIGGEVVKAQRAPFLHRNGKLLLIFPQIQVSSAAPQSMQVTWEGVEASVSSPHPVPRNGGGFGDSSSEWKIVGCFSLIALILFCSFQATW